MRSLTMLKFAMGAFLTVSATLAATDAGALPPPRQVTPSGPGSRASTASSHPTRPSSSRRRDCHPERRR